MKHLVFAPPKKRSTFISSFLILFILLCSVKSSFATDYATDFEFSDTSGLFTKGTPPKTVTFTNGEVKTALMASLYRSGTNAFMVESNTATIEFETAAAQIQVYLKAQSGAAGAVVNVYDINDNIVDSYTATTSWQAININSIDGISRMELINMTSSYAVFEDFSFTAIAPPPPPGDPIKLDDPIPFPISSGLKLKLNMTTTGLTAPLWGVAAPGVTDFFYIVEQTGQLLAVDKISGMTTMLMDLSADLVPLGIEEFGGFDERGLLGIAFHPQFASNKLFYTYSSQPNGAMADFSTMPMNMAADHQGVLTEWQADIGGTEGIIINMASARELLRIDEPQFNHNGGAIAVDSSGLLYVAIGDGGGADDVDGQDFLNAPMVGHGDLGNGQNIETILGTIIRIAPLGNNSANGAYGIPASNPMVNADGLDEIYAYGLRNPYRLSFDSQTGELYAADVGQNDPRRQSWRPGRDRCLLCLSCVGRGQLDDRADDPTEWRLGHHLIELPSLMRPRATIEGNLRWDVAKERTRSSPAPAAVSGEPSPNAWRRKERRWFSPHRGSEDTATSMARSKRVPSRSKKRAGTRRPSSQIYSTATPERISSSARRPPSARSTFS